jgi:hypothetical protein
MNKPHTLDELRENFRRGIQMVTPEVLAATFRNMQHHVQSCIELREGISSTSCDNRISYRYDMQTYCTFVLFVNQHFLGLPTSGTHCIIHDSLLKVFILKDADSKGI